jgi:hypothetical protein
MHQPGSCVFYFLDITILACTLTAQQQPKQLPAAKSSAPAHIDPGIFTNGTYRNSSLGFSYRLPFGWVDRTHEISNPADDAAQAMTLLAAFERPPEARGDTVNSAVVIAAEAASRYPGLQNAEHYFGPLTELTKAKEFAVVNPPYEFSVGTKPLVRGDFSKDLGKLTMHQSTLVMMDKGYVVSFTLIGGTKDEVDGLVEGLSFNTKQAPASHK